VNITFGVVVGPSVDHKHLQQLIHSIDSQNWSHLDKWEIILIGDSVLIKDYGQHRNVRLIPFDETQKAGWITRKKNIIVKEASYHRLVLLHDYYYLIGPGWVQAFREFGSDWDIQMHRVLLPNQARHSDWLVDQQYMDVILDKHPTLGAELMAIAPNENGPRWICGLDYDVKDIPHLQYISGGYIVARKHVLETIPLNEKLAWGDAEDVEWSRRAITAGFYPKMNHHCAVGVQKGNKWQLYTMNDNALTLLRQFFGSLKCTTNLSSST
jgi:GT2 family glycosyltransferase